MSRQLIRWLTIKEKRGQKMWRPLVLNNRLFEKEEINRKVLLPVPPSNQNPFLSQAARHPWRVLISTTLADS
jgi:hypothetical protein